MALDSCSDMLAHTRIVVNGSLPIRQGRGQPDEAKAVVDHHPLLTNPVIIR